jgi:hypothetical protein
MWELTANVCLSLCRYLLLIVLSSIDGTLYITLVFLVLEIV